MFDSVTIRGHRGLVDVSFVEAVSDIILTINENPSKINVVKKTLKTIIIDFTANSANDETHTIVKIHRYSFLSGFRIISKSQKAFQAFQHLKPLGINTPAPLAVLDKRNYGILRESWYITEKLSEVESIDWYFKRYFLGKPCRHDLKWKRRLIYELAELIALLHTEGLYHNDLKAGNILVQGKDVACKLFLIDLDSIKIVHKVNKRRRMKNLSQIMASMKNIFSQKDIYRFLIKYCKKSQSQGLRLELRQIMSAEGKKILQ